MNSLLFIVFYLVQVFANPSGPEILQGRSSAAAGSGKVRAVNLGGWLVVEKWMKPSLFDDAISENRDLLDGAHVQLKSMRWKTYVCAEGGGNDKVVVNRESASGWETFKLWRVSSAEFQLRVFNNKFVTVVQNGQVLANADTPNNWETITLERNGSLVHLKAFNGLYLQAKDTTQLTADYKQPPGWDDNPAVFELSKVRSLDGEFQLANALGPDKAAQVFKEHRDTFITGKDLKFLADNKINTVRVPVGWWIAYDPQPPPPFVSGSLEALDNAFEWSERNRLKVIVDLHAAPGGQNPFEHSANRDGVTGWNNPENIAKSLEVIHFLANRYKDHPALLGIELLNEPAAADVPLTVLTKYYREGYHAVRSHTSSAYVLFSQSIGADPEELVSIMKPSSNYSRVVLDVHLYNLFSDTFENKSVEWHVEFIKENRTREIERLDSAGGASVFVGEWTNAWNVGGATKADYVRFGDAQLACYGNASFGWAYWSLRSNSSDWDFKNSLQNGHLRRNGTWH